MTETMPTCALRTTTGIEIPLRGVKIDGKIAGGTAEITLAQRFANTEQVPVEAVYVFPLESQAAVCRFRALVGDRVIDGRVEEKERAFEIYDDAMADGHGAMLLDQERPNVFTISVGNLAPDTEVVIEITYAMRLEFEGSAVRLMIPTTVSPRYVPAPDAPEVGQPSGDRVNPPHWPRVPYGFELALDVDLGAPIKSVDSPSHQTRTELSGDTARISLSRESVAMDRDFVLLVEPQAAFEPRATVAAEADGTRVVMVEFVPDPDQRLKAKEVHFVLDCSGSMGGDSIEQATRALKLCLRQLDEGDTFNVTAFGSAHESLWGEPRPVTTAHVEAATAFLNRGANMGGTEILTPLRAILSTALDAERPRQVILLTDGQVSNEDQVIALAEAHRGAARIFSFGIGAGVSKHLVESAARVSGGAAEFIYPGERIEPKILRMFGRVATPALEEISVDWGELGVDQAPAEITSIFAGDPLTVFARVKHGSTDAVTLRAKGFEARVAVDLEHAGTGGPLPVLWAKQRIQDLEDGVAGVRHGSSQRRPGRDPEAALNKKLVELGKRYGLVSRATSYVAVETRADADKTTEQAQLRTVPVALTAGWGGHGSVLGGAGAMPPLQQASFGGMGPGGGGAPNGAPMGAPPPPRQRSAPVRGLAMQSAPMPAMAQERSRDLKKKAKGRSGGGLLSKIADGVSSLVGSRTRADAPAEEGAAAAPSFDSFDRMSSFEGEKELREETPALDALVADGDFDDAESEGGGVDALYDVLMRQAVDGSFALDDVLLALLGADAEKARADAASSSPAIVATMLVIEWLDRVHAARRDEWKAAAGKAQRWLARQN